MASQEERERWRHKGFDAVLTASDGETPRGVFRGTYELYFDEPEYINVGGCQLETLKQCLEKGDTDEYEIEIQIEVDDDMPGTADIRITDITVEVPPEHEPRASRCLDIFERHCPISQSVDTGVTLHTSATLPIDGS